MRDLLSGWSLNLWLSLKSATILSPRSACPYSRLCQIQVSSQCRGVNRDSNFLYDSIMMLDELGSGLVQAYSLGQSSQMTNGTRIYTSFKRSILAKACVTSFPKQCQTSALRSLLVHFNLYQLRISGQISSSLHRQIDHVVVSRAHVRWQFWQAFHWCHPDYDSAAAEFGRILKPGGVLALIWNLEDR